MLDVVILTPQETLFQGRASRVILPGEAGTFEVGPFHRPLVSRLLPGFLIVDEQSVLIRRGVVKVERNKVTSIIEVER